MFKLEMLDSGDGAGGLEAKTRIAIGYLRYLRVRRFLTWRISLQYKNVQYVPGQWTSGLKAKRNNCWVVALTIS